MFHVIIWQWTHNSDLFIIFVVFFVHEIYLHFAMVMDAHRKLLSYVIIVRLIETCLEQARLRSLHWYWLVEWHIRKNNNLFWIHSNGAMIFKGIPYDKREHVTWRLKICRLFGNLLNFYRSGAIIIVFEILNDTHKRMAKDV